MPNLIVPDLSDEEKFDFENGYNAMVQGLRSGSNWSIGLPLIQPERSI